MEEVTRIIRLLRKKTLENADKESSLQMLYQRKEAQEVSLEKLEGRPPDDFVDPYIELTRIINRITLVEKEHLQKQLQLAEQFFPNVGNYTPPPGKEAAFAQYQTGPNTPLVTVGVELSPNTPMDSALVEVTRALSQRGVVLGNYRGFLRLSGRKVSLFERGVFGSAITKSMDRNVCPQSVYEEVALGREAPASSVQSSPVPSPNPPPRPTTQRLTSADSLLFRRTPSLVVRSNKRCTLSWPSDWPSTFGTETAGACSASRQDRLSFA